MVCLVNDMLCVLPAGGALAIAGTYLLVTFAPHFAPHVTANMVERSLMSWEFLTYIVSMTNDWMTSGITTPVPPYRPNLGCLTHR